MNGKKSTTQVLKLMIIVNKSFIKIKKIYKAFIRCIVCQENENINVQLINVEHSDARLDINQELFTKLADEDIEQLPHRT